MNISSKCVLFGSLKLINALAIDLHSRVSDPEQVHDGDGRSRRCRGDSAGGGGRPAPA